MLVSWPESFSLSTHFAPPSKTGAKPGPSCYDWRLRAIKSELVVAGSLKRELQTYRHSTICTVMWLRKPNAEI